MRELINSERACFENWKSTKSASFSQMVILSNRIYREYTIVKILIYNSKHRLRQVTCLLKNILDGNFIRRSACWKSSNFFTNIRQVPSISTFSNFINFAHSHGLPPYQLISQYFISQLMRLRPTVSRTELFSLFNLRVFEMIECKKEKKKNWKKRIIENAVCGQIQLYSFHFNFWQKFLLDGEYDEISCDLSTFHQCSRRYLKDWISNFKLIALHYFRYWCRYCQNWIHYLFFPFALFALVRLSSFQFRPSIYLIEHCA